MLFVVEQRFVCSHPSRYFETDVETRGDRCLNQRVTLCIYNFRCLRSGTSFKHASHFQLFSAPHRLDINRGGALDAKTHFPPTMRPQPIIIAETMIIAGAKRIETDESIFMLSNDNKSMVPISL